MTRTFDGLYPAQLLRLLLLCLLALGSAPAYGQADLNGFWDLQMPSPDGNVRHTYFELRLNGETLTGKMFGRTVGGQPIKGTVKDGELHFSAAPAPRAPGTLAPSGSAAASMVYDGTYRDGKLMLQWHRYEGTIVSGDAVRTTEAATRPPAPLPLPPLKTLPDNGLVAHAADGLEQLEQVRRPHHRRRRPQHGRRHGLERHE